MKNFNKKPVKRILWIPLSKIEKEDQLFEDFFNELSFELTEEQEQ